MSDSILISTGYATITREVMKRLWKTGEFDITHFGWQFIGNPCWYNPDDEVISDKKRGIQLIPSSGKSQFGNDILQAYIKRYKPDLTYILADTFMLHDWIYNIDFAPSKFLMYFPSDGEPMPIWCENVLRKANYPVAMSKFAQEQVKRCYNIDVDYIPHGVDTNFYHPVDDMYKYNLRKKWSQKLQIDLENKFVVACVGRFQGRKAHPELLKAWQMFSKDKKDVVLLMHCDPEDPAGLGPYPILWELIKRYKIEHNTRFTGTKVWFQFPFEEYREIYQISDIHALATTGEGFGIPTIEAGACGLPNIITDFTTTKELVEDDGVGISVPLKMTITGTWGVERGFVDIEKFAEALNTLYYDEKLRKSMGEKARKKVIRDYNWDTVVFPMWYKYIKERLE